MSILAKIIGPVVALVFPRPKVEFNFSDLIDFLMDYIHVDDLQDAYDTLRREFGNPFRPGMRGVWGTVRHNIDLVSDVILAIVQSLERITIGGRELEAPEKLEIAAEALDRLVSMPWYMRPFARPAFKLIISIAVGHMNSVQWAPTGRVTEKQQIAISQKKIELKVISEGKKTKLVPWDMA